MNKITISIGIPAYNEEKNIVNLLTLIRQQNSHQVELEKIIVVSDGSTDKTAILLRKIKDKKLLTIENKKRIGKAGVLNKIFKLAQSKLLLILDADVVIKDHNFLEKIVREYLRENFDLLGIRVLELPPHNFLQRMLKLSMDMKREMYEDLNNGDNVYSCHGRARAFFKQYYKSLVIKQSMNEDAFSYLWCKKKNLIYRYTKKAAVYYQLPATLSDHIKQSRRFFSSQSVEHKGLSLQFINKQYQIPGKKFAAIMLQKMLTSPLLTFSYLVLVVTIRIYNGVWKFNLDKWQTSVSTKKLTVNLTV
ncbi:glycosyltransferase family 2 protein [Candidatus Microgenomates bacterium]|nr:glycosyltransferase family 2 protein [Candidatus Microgenomates bacterium]